MIGFSLYGCAREFRHEDYINVFHTSISFMKTTPGHDVVDPANRRSPLYRRLHEGGVGTHYKDLRPDKTGLVLSMPLDSLGGVKNRNGVCN